MTTAGPSSASSTSRAAGPLGSLSGGAAGRSVAGGDIDADGGASSTGQVQVHGPAHPTAGAFAVSSAPLAARAA